MTKARRGFLKSLAVVPLAPAALGPQAPAAAAAPGAAVARALTGAVKLQYGARLDAADLEAVEKEIARSLERAEKLQRRVRLGNADEPVTRFEARPPSPAPPRGER